LNLRPGFFKNEGSDKMNEPIIDCDEQILSDELPDAALEIAAAKYGEVGNPFTIAFCSGLDTCPA
jgi:hypothetical protein